MLQTLNYEEKSKDDSSDGEHANMVSLPDFNNFVAI